ncbi:hypothetical protein MNBD_ALPHA08-465 [hydrothermal vent metagenome]|uniref:VWFA domain-containing protein n=1 Tax=hydrothermal vent metagenome TaxID=652676 RepID=A0A3B0QZR5_9ZZZZ
MITIIKCHLLTCKSFRRHFVFGLVVLAVVAAGFQSRNQANALETTVDMTLVFAIDVSYSVDEDEFRLQMDGLALAFQQPAVHKAIKSGPNQKIAVAVTQWAGEHQQVVAVSWTVIDGPAAALQFAQKLVREPRRIAEGGTATGAAMRHAGALLLSAPFKTYRKVVDISSDGRSNRGVWPENVRDQLAARNITVNGLAILNEWPTLDEYFKNKVVGGPYNFVIVANDYRAYTDAIRQKLIKEITGPGIS